MALTELQLPVKDQFYRNCQGVASQAINMSLRWNEISEFIQTVTAADLDAMGIDAGQVRTDLVDFRASLNNIVAAIQAEEASLDKIRTMVVI